MYIHWRTREGRSRTTQRTVWVAELAASHRTPRGPYRLSVAHLASIENECAQPDGKADRLADMTWLDDVTMKEARWYLSTGWFDPTPQRVRFWLRALGNLALSFEEGQEDALRPLVDALARRVPLPSPAELAWYRAVASHGSATPTDIPLWIAPDFQRVEARGLVVLRTLLDRQPDAA